MNDNSIFYDWVSFSSKVDSVNSILSLLGLGTGTIPWENTYGVHGYRDRLSWDGININYNPFRTDEDQPVVFVELSGQGCRRFEESSAIADNNDDKLPCLLRFLRSDTENYNLTRLDVAYDDFNKVINLKSIINDIHAFNFVSKFQEKSFRVEEHAGHVGQTIYMGSQKSAVMFRIYDKKYERGREDVPHWVRFEIQLRQDRAGAFADAVQNDYKDLGKVFYGVINNYVRFVVPSVVDSNKRRWKLRPYWSRFLQFAEQIQLYTSHSTDYNLSRFEKYVHLQSSNAIECLINVKGVDKFLFDMYKDKPVYSEKYSSISGNTDGILKFLRERGVLDV